jgi:putative ABC transport system permease protein
MKFLRRLRLLFPKEQLDQQLSDELRFHLEKQIEQNVVAGMSAEEARYAALRKFGGVEQVKEECRDAWGVRSIETLLQDLRYGLRMLAKGPGFTAVAILTLAIGIGANTAIFSLIDAVMLRMLPVPRADELRLVRFLNPRRGGEGNTSFTNALWEQVRYRQDVFSGVFAWGDDRFDLAQGGAVHYANGMWVSGDLFKTLELRPAAGRLITSSDDQRGCPGAAVLSYGFWQEHYGGAPKRYRQHPFAQHAPL